MFGVALCGLLLAPIVWTYRRLQVQVDLERMAAETARMQAEAVMLRARAGADEAAFDAAIVAATDPFTPGSHAKPPDTLWAALGVSHPLFVQGRAKDLSIEFTLVNDTKQPIEPKLAESRIVINGKELADSGSMMARGATPDRFRTLAPGDHLQFTLAVGEHFHGPGIYLVSWKGQRFQSPEIVLRILPVEAD
jgi:hypothetical protein